MEKVSSLSRNDLEQHELTALSQTSLGQYLRAARESMGIYNLEEVTRYLKIRKEVIEDIERDDYRAGLPLVFMRGYLRAYAKFLGLPETPVLDTFNKMNVSEEQLLVSVKNLQEKPKITNERHVRWLTYTIATVLLLLVGLWWSGYKKTEAVIEPVQLDAQVLGLISQYVAALNLPVTTPLEETFSLVNIEKIAIPRKIPKIIATEFISKKPISESEEEDDSVDDGE